MTPVLPVSPPLPLIPPVFVAPRAASTPPASPCASSRGPEPDPAMLDAAEAIHRQVYGAPE
jgi:hypothetical protein